jgi:hypothetical protein
MNISTFASYQKPIGPLYVNWNQMSDRAIASNQKTYVPSFGSSTKSSITRERPGSQSPGGVGCDIKHNSYNRYLNKLRGKQKCKITLPPPPSPNTTYCLFRVIGKNPITELTYLPVVEDVSKLTISVETTQVDAKTLLIKMTYKVIGGSTAGVGIAIKNDASNYYNQYIDTIDFLEFGGFPLYDGGSQFSGLTINIFFSATDSPGLRPDIDISQMFYNNTKFNANINVLNTWKWNTISTMFAMFGSCPKFNNGSQEDDGNHPLIINNLLTACSIDDNTNQYALSYLFLGCDVFNQTVTLGPLNASIVSYIFSSCYIFNNGSTENDALRPLTLIINNNRITDISSMFITCYKFNQKIILKDITTNDTITTLTTLENISSLFNDCTVFNNGGVKLNWSFSKFETADWIADAWDVYANAFQTVNKPDQLQ